jgi:DNA invertase Pin-like site-specific DNA recombinase
MAKHTAVYLRVSTATQSTDLQRREIETYLTARQISDFHIYEDQMSGTTSSRPALQKLMADARAARIELVICWKLDRLFRSLRNLLGTLHEFERLGVGFISVKDQIDLATPSGRLMTHLIAAFAEFEADLIRERVRAGVATARAKGKRLGRPPKITKGLVIEMRKAGMSLRSIADKLGVSKSAVHKVLQESAAQLGQTTGGKNGN